MLGALGSTTVAVAVAPAPKGRAGAAAKAKKNPKDAKAGKGERKTRSRLACLPCKSTFPFLRRGALVTGMQGVGYGWEMTVLRGL